MYIVVADGMIEVWMLRVKNMAPAQALLRCSILCPNGVRTLGSKVLPRFRKTVKYGTVFVRRYCSLKDMLKKRLTTKTR